MHTCLPHLGAYTGIVTTLKYISLQYTCKGMQLEQTHTHIQHYVLIQFCGLHVTRLNCILDILESCGENDLRQTGSLILLIFVLINCILKIEKDIIPILSDN